jgi:ubiquinone/menaquinone biosynthesis C-methylase UbiE
MNKFLWDVKEKLYRIFRYRFPFRFIIQQENDNIERLLNLIETNGNVIADLGTGNGSALIFFEQAKEMFGVDVTFSMLRRARQLHPETAMIQADAINLPLQNRSVDIASAIGLSEYIKDIDSFLFEVHRIVKDNGHFLLTFSPFGITTLIRSLFGNRIYPRSLKQIEAMTQRLRFQVIRTEHSFMQWQVLLQKI